MRHRLVKWWCNFLLRLASGGYKFSVRQSTSCPTKRFNSSALRLHQSTPDLRTIIRYPSCVSTFITSFSIFIPKPNSKLPFFKWLSRALSLSPNTISYCFSHLLCWELFGHRRRWTPTTRLTVSFKKNMSHLAWLNSCGFISWKKKKILFLWWFLTEACDCHKPHWTSLCCVKMSALNLNLLAAPTVRSEISQIPLPHLVFVPLSCYPHYVAVQYLCIYFCCYLMIIIYCIRTRFALFEDE